MFVSAVCSAAVQRRALSNHALVRLVVGHVLGIVADSAAYIGMLVYVFDRDGAEAAALASMLSLIPLVVSGPFVARALSGNDPALVRTAALATQGIALTAAAVAASQQASSVTVTAIVTLAVTATTVQRPAVAMMTPTLARRPEDLVAANLWIAYGSSASSLLGPALTAMALALSGVSATLVVSGSTAIAASVISFRAVPRRGHREPIAGSHLATGRAALRRTPGARTLVAISAVHYAMLTSFGIVAVVIARDALDLGESGPGLLNVLFGIGTLFASVGATIALKGAKLAPSLVWALVISSLAYAALAIDLELPVAIVALPLIGLGRVFVNEVTRVLLQRSTPTDDLAPVFAVMQSATGIGGIIGSAAVQVLLWAGGLTFTLWGLAVALMVAAVVGWPGLRQADASADVPLVAMALLRHVDLFAAMPALEIESLARTASNGAAVAGTTVMTEGEPGDRFYVLADGSCRVSIGGEFVRQLGRGSPIGEVALLANVPRTATVVAESDIEYLSIDRDDFLHVLTGSPDTHHAVWTHVDGLYFPDGAPPGR